eukprot:TRINITY_DN5975_c0_g1_i1.p1 TRINITY_DN5975_c0_g1~~TRINITY_DN5975_c0_g1_i1.p1  ORF type:complete len:270 (+),score=33.90 TRINITY_DN5975_c0_g1_i1:233-1042(+)
MTVIEQKDDDNDDDFSRRKWYHRFLVSKVSLVFYLSCIVGALLVVTLHKTEIATSRFLYLLVTSWFATYYCLHYYETLGITFTPKERIGLFATIIFLRNSIPFFLMLKVFNNTRWLVSSQDYNFVEESIEYLLFESFMGLMSSVGYIIVFEVFIRFWKEDVPQQTAYTILDDVIGLTPTGIKYQSEKQGDIVEMTTLPGETGTVVIQEEINEEVESLVRDEPFFHASPTTSSRQSNSTSRNFSYSYPPLIMLRSLLSSPDCFPFSLILH